MKLYMFRTVSVSIIRSFPLYTQQWYMSYRFADSLRAGSEWICILIQLASCQQTCMTYTIVVCTVENSWWWTQKLSEACRVSFQKKFWKVSASSCFYYKKNIKGFLILFQLKIFVMNLLLNSIRFYYVMLCYYIPVIVLLSAIPNVTTEGRTDYR